MTPRQLHHRRCREEDQASQPRLLAYAIAISPTAYATADFESTSTVESDMPGPMPPIQTATRTPGKPMQPGNNPQAIAITPDGTIAYVVNWQGPGRVTPVRTATGTHEKPIKVGSHPIVIALAPG